MNRNQNIKVSIIVPIYKVEPFLDKLIKSVLCQSHSNFELILVDDGSPDGSGKICDKYTLADKRVIVIHQKNAGGGEARNTGMRHATGEFISFIDGDDWVEPDYIEYLLDLIFMYNADMALSDSIFTTRDRKQNEEDKIEKWSADDAVEAMLTYIPIGAWGKLYRKDMLDKSGINFSVPFSGEGMYFICMAAQYASCVVKGHRRVYNYRLNNHGSTLTQYNVRNGINALWNIKNIGKVSPIQSTRIRRAVEWHTWLNYSFLLRQIVGTKQERKYWKEYCRCLICPLLHFPMVISYGGYSRKQIWSMLKHSLFPLRYVKAQIQHDRSALEMDKFEE